MKVEGKGRVFAKERDGWTSYTIGVSSKDQDGKWQNAYQPVRFRKGEKVPNGTDIEFVGFPTVMKGEKYNYVLWQITEFRNVGDEMSIPDRDIDLSEEVNEFTALTNDDIPF